MKNVEDKINNKMLLCNDEDGSGSEPTVVISGSPGNFVLQPFENALSFDPSLSSVFLKTEKRTACYP